MFVVFRNEHSYHIDKMQMNGIGIKTKLVDSDLLGPKVSLCYDRYENKLFWSDQGTGRIESVAITGSHFNLVITDVYILQTNFKTYEIDITYFLYRKYYRMFVCNVSLLTIIRIL